MTAASRAGVHASPGEKVSLAPERNHRLPRPVPRPQPGQPPFLYEIAELEVDAVIAKQVAQVQVAQTFKNPTSRTLQVKFVFPLPHDGAIDQMTFMVDGQEIEGRLLDADKARDIYQSYLRRSLDPALVQWIGTGMFQTQVFPLPPGAERTVSLRYTQVCKRSGSLCDWSLPLAPARFTARPITRISIQGRIRSETGLGNVYSPSHDIKVDRDGEVKVLIIDAMFRMKMFFEDAGKMKFARNMRMPGSIEDEIKNMIRGALF